MEGMQARIVSFCSQHRIDVLYAFGSRGVEARELLEGARDALRESPSDLDIAALPADGVRLSVREKVEISSELEALFQVPRVDLVLFNEADPFLAANIIRGERLFCADVLAADEYELYVLRRAGDLAPLERERLSLLQAR